MPDSKIETEGIKYTGSKLKLIPNILDIAHQVAPKRVLDGFAGTTRVSQAFAKSGYDVTCLDISPWSFTMGTCYLLGRNRETYRDLISHLNSVEPLDGWFSEHYGGDPDHDDGRKYPWQKHNTRKLDGIREEIDHLNLPHIEKSVALTSLMLALDKVDNTLGHFTSYLKSWSARSFHEFSLDIPLVVESEKLHEVVQGDILQTISGRHFDLAYLDPPYGSNNEKMPASRVRYAPYYHLWKTLCLNDRPDIFGAARQREDSRDRQNYSPFEDFHKNEDGDHIATEAIAKLLDEIRADHIILSYSSGGRAAKEDLLNAINNIGELISLQEIPYGKNVMSRMSSTDEWIAGDQKRHVEYLFYIVKS